MTSLAVIGSTGSIGTSALDVVEKFMPEIRVVGLAAGRNLDLLSQQIKKHRPKTVVVPDAESATRLKGLLSDYLPNVFYGGDALKELAASDESDTVLVSVSGALGVWPAWEAAGRKKRVALATKESLVLLGDALLKRATASGAEIIPVDSEHSALFQLLRGVGKKEIKALWLAASGGPFRNSDAETLKKVTVEQALAHPVWKMGPKITIDSATLMNKGLEIIEAKWLFDVSAEDIQVVIQPQGLVHAMVELIDGTMLMHAGNPDMRAPIAYAFGYPDRTPNVLPRLNLAEIGSLKFDKPDYERFPCLGLARHALALGGSAPAALNGADEVAVEAFLNKKISFMDIPRVISATLESHKPKPINGPEDALEADICARKAADGIINGGKLKK